MCDVAAMAGRFREVARSAVELPDTDEAGGRPMTIDSIIYLGRDAMLVTLLVSAPMLVAGLAVGLLISIFQAVTQIQEMTLTFVPKIVAVMVTFLLFLPWMMGILLQFVQPLFGNFGMIVR